jgi:hypothetical protein
VQQVLEKTKCARINLVETKKVLKENNCTTTVESGEDDDTKQTVLFFKMYLKGISN